MYDQIATMMLIPLYLLVFIQNHNVLQDAHPSMPHHLKEPMSKAAALRNKFCPTLNSLSEVFITTGFMEFTGHEIIDSFLDDQELSFKFMSYLVQCLRHDESD